MRIRIYITLFTSLLLFLHSDGNFKVIVLGCGGGPNEANVSGYLVSTNQNHFLALDAGTVLSGIYLAYAKQSFAGIKLDSKSRMTPEGEILQSHIKAYLLSHAHLDHISALVINSPVDTSKPIYGLNSTIDYLRDYIFNWKIWTNFGSEGERPLNKYTYMRMEIEKVSVIRNLKMRVVPFLLSHPDGYQSTAFLIESGGNYLLYFGDTAPDSLEPEKRIHAVWEKVAPLIREKKLKGIFLECSYTDIRPTNQMFGHLSPKYVTKTLHDLASLVDPNNPKTALKDLNVIITHIKEPLLKGPPPEKIIKATLEKANDLGIHFIFPEQGSFITL